MRLTRKIALAAGVLAVLSAVSLAQQQASPDSPPRPQTAQSAGGPETLVVPDGNIEFIERALVASRREGIIKQIELSIGHEAQEGNTIALLDDTMADLTLQKAKLFVDDDSGIADAEARKELALASMARAERLVRFGAQNISKEEYQTKQAELKVAEAAVLKAQEEKKLARKEYEIAKQTLDEHQLNAPFDGEIFEVLKHTGEAVQALEPVVVMVKTDRVRFFGYVPLETAYRLKKGLTVDISPVIEGSNSPLRNKRFRGKLVFIAPELATSRRDGVVQIKADINNNMEKDLRPGMKVEMTVYLTDNEAEIPPPPSDMLRLPEPKPIEDEPTRIGSRPDVRTAPAQ